MPASRAARSRRRGACREHRHDPRLGIIGGGSVSTAYLSRASLVRGIEMRAVAEIEPEAPKVCARKHRVRAMSVDKLLAAPTST